MNHPVMGATEQDEIVEIGASPVDPVLDVVRLAPFRGGRAAGMGAAARIHKCSISRQTELLLAFGKWWLYRYACPSCQLPTP